ncbi:membrane protein insertase YidC [Nocardia bovistercoris]|uniref:Membrane protein insertase YidC n=1 Tax=Nocardia bovistercoris TaxID=2785916 RepID=A0A931N760_9NOCA|nr:membrane protein insertase YidC [Nocardia bovistercoris]
MLDFIYYPVSWILWFWHRVFAAIPGLGPDHGLAWALAVVFLVFSLRVLLYKPFVRQVRTTKQMQELQPQIKELQKKYKNDRQKLALEMQKLQKEHGFNPLMGCLPMLAQVPVFLGLFHVLRSFNRTGHGFGQLGMSPEQNAMTPNYVFNAADVQSFLSARIFGAPISAFITTPTAELQAFADYGGIPSKLSIALVAIPLMVIAGLATHFNARASVQRQTPEAAANPQAALMNKLALWVFPLGVLVGGPFLPIAILLYWVSNNIWTYGQQHLVFGRMAKEEEEKKQAKLEQRAQNAPKPGAKPVSTKKKPATPEPASDAETVSDAVENPSSTNGVAKNGSRGSGQRRPGNQKRSGNRGRANQKRRR